jgi:carbon-monoxide dehydrogenase medium subunit
LAAACRILIRPPDYPAAVLALEGDISLASDAGARSVKAEDFFVDLMTTAAKAGEILTQVSFAPIPANSGFTYLKHRQPASGFAIVGVAALVTLGRGGVCERVRVGITGLGPKAFRAKVTENALVRKTASAEAIAAAALHAADGIDPLSDIHAAADFRAELARVYTRRALASAIAGART